MDRNQRKEQSAGAADERPALRLMDAVPVEQDGERMMVLSDPERFSEVQMMVSIPAFYLLTLMDGAHDLGSIQKEFQKRFRAHVRMEEIQSLVDQMDNALMLDNERFARHRESVVERFMSLPARPAFFAGQSYPADPEELAGKLKSVLGGPGGEGRPPARAIVVPHIDFNVGADMMGAGWREVAASGADLFIILGVGHCLSDDFFAVLDKDFETPIGPMRVDRPFLRKLEENFGEGIYGQALAHMREHSIEFQALFMASLFGDRPDVTAVPIILSFPENAWELNHPVFNGARIDRFIRALKKTAAEAGRKTVYVASADLSHVGRRFGDMGPLGSGERARVRADDEELLRAVGRMDAEWFLEKIKSVNDRNRVCGFPALYAMLNAVEAENGEVLEYRQNMEGAGETMVSFATMILR